MEHTIGSLYQIDEQEGEVYMLCMVCDRRTQLIRIFPIVGAGNRWTDNSSAMHGLFPYPVTDSILMSMTRGKPYTQLKEA
jgi:hypothetical protein